jgi:heme/copper-type cytochrome/quinol oxidase subunit 1
MTTSPWPIIAVTIVGATLGVLIVAGVAMAVPRLAGLRATLAPTTLFASAAIVIAASALALGFKRSNPPIDGPGIHLHPSFWFVVHMRYPSLGLIAFGSIALVYALWPRLTKGTLDTWIGQVHFWITFFAFELAFAPFGKSAQQYGVYNRIETISSLFFMGSFAIGILNMVLSLVQRRPRG